MSKIEVNGPHTHPVYAWLRMNSDMSDEKQQKAKLIGWNYNKFILTKDGKVGSHYPQHILPLDLAKEIKYLLE